MKRPSAADDEMVLDLVMESFKKVRLATGTDLSQEDKSHLSWDGVSQPAEGSVFFYDGYEWTYSARLQLWWVGYPERIYWSQELGWGTW